MAKATSPSGCASHGRNSRRPGDPCTCAKLGSLEVAEGNLRRGLALLEEGLKHCPTEAHPERYELLLHLALAQAGKNPPQAEQYYRQALAIPLAPRLNLAAQLNLAALLCSTVNSRRRKPSVPGHPRRP